MFGKVERPDGGYIFHGGCGGCETHQSKCHECQYESADWSLPNLNTAHAAKELEREAAKRRCRRMTPPPKLRVVGKMQ